MVRKRGKSRNPKQALENSKVSGLSDNKSNTGIPAERARLSALYIWAAAGVMLLVGIAAVYHRQVITEMKKSSISEETSLFTIEPHQNVSLFSRYSVNYTSMLRIREENMKKYSFPFNLNGVDKRSNLSLQEYRDVYDGKWPVVLTDVVPEWKAFQWNRDFFRDHYGDENAVISILHAAFDRKPSMALPIELFHKQANKAKEDSWMYIQDEFFITQRPKLYKSIGEVIYLKENYYTLFPRAVRPWDAQLLWGTAFSRSTLHIDPYNWTGTNAVISGLKRWKLYPPGQDDQLYVMPGRYCGFPLECYKYNSEVDAFNPDYEKFPKLKKATAIEFDQLPGELLLIPTGWFHQAYNAEETIAISSQVMNRNNFRIVLEEILKHGTVKRRNLPKNIDTLSPEQQVEVAISLLPKETVQQGEALTKHNLEQIELGHEHQLHLFPNDAVIRRM